MTSHSSLQRRDRGRRDDHGEQRPTRPALRFAWGVLKWTALSLTIMVILGAGGLATIFAVYGADGDLPDVKSLQRPKMKQVTRIVAGDGETVIGEIFEERRSVVTYRDLPLHLINAITAAEDAKFFSHEGLDLLGMVRAFFANLRAGRYKQGGSTITQQVVKSFLLSPKRTLRRKVQEVILARRLEKELTKKQILTLYLNKIYLGHGRYGVQEAARYYFGKKRVKEISLAQAAMLAALPRGPEIYSPFRSRKAARTRRDYVLRRMNELGMISATQRAAANAEPLPRRPHVASTLAPEFVTRVRQLLIRRYGKKQLPYLGLTVYTTVDLELQRAARRAVARGLRRIDGSPTSLRRRRPLGRRARTRELKRLAKSQRGKLRPGKTYDAIVVGFDERRGTAIIDLGGGRRRELAVRSDKRHNPKGLAPSKLLAKHTRVRVTPTGEDKPWRLAEGAQAAVVLIDVATREIRAMIGGADFSLGDFNRALRAVRQPGSTFKPIIYAAALEDKRITPAELLPDAPHPCENWLRIRRRGDKRYHGRMLPRAALAQSINSIACRVFQRVGSARVRQLARRLGITTKMTPHLSLALGASGVRPIELAGAFATLAGAGTYRKPTLIRRLDSLPAEATRPRQAISPATAYVVTSMLRSVVQAGTARRARRVRNAAGKTGTSNRNRDAWFVGYTPNLAGVVWVGRDDFRPLGRGGSGGRAAVPIWADIFRHRAAHTPRRDFPRPKQVVAHHIDPRTGNSVAAHTPGAQLEYFVPGTQPPVAVTPTGPVLDEELD